MGADYNRVENRVEMVGGRKNLIDKLVRGSGQISTDTSYIALESCVVLQRKLEAPSSKEDWRRGES